MRVATTAAYIRTQAAVAGLINFVVNPAIDWLSLRHKGAQPIWGADGLVVNFVITSLILSTLVGIFAQWGVRREKKAGRVHSRNASSSRWLHRLPRRGWVAGPVLGAAAAVVVIALFWALHGLGMTKWSLAALMAVKAVYCGLLGFLVARWVISRHLA
ncbi:hypothetical protein H7I95_19020 [Mycolicibacterium elephantis]|uniref:Uncharacterized protein n=1 Tax=Mycolicibacterium elephantis DSM 44368 TaxID=1335622 RepID=A0A439DWP5_9MYCO|nr:hypothetical protein [Mycolicibacterium elephantis]RWA21676.1 hypothetical protein MELE44368_15010 [Mycolicibacterium elephantis DSM 44368]